MAGCHALLVPYALDGETEQTDRAERLERIGRVGVIAEATLSDETLAAAIRREIGRRLPAQALEVNVDGATRSAEILLNFVKNKAQG